MGLEGHPTVGELAAAGGRRGLPARLRLHLVMCPACQLSASRIWQAPLPGPPSDAEVARILEASQPLPPGLVATLAASPVPVPPQPGELWQVGGSEAFLAWVWHARDDGADVIPAVLDVELADQHAVLVSPGATPLGVPLALLTSARGPVALAAMLRRIGHVDVARQVDQAVCAARRDLWRHGAQGRRPPDGPAPEAG